MKVFVIVQADDDNNNNNNGYIVQIQYSANLSVKKTQGASAHNLHIQTRSLCRRKQGSPRLVEKACLRGVLCFKKIKEEMKVNELT